MAVVSTQLVDIYIQTFKKRKKEKLLATTKLTVICFSLHARASASSFGNTSGAEFIITAGKTAVAFQGGDLINFIKKKKCLYNKGYYYTI
jgi:hypothetical protein